jgi:hypothetical protein
MAMTALPQIPTKRQLISDASIALGVSLVRILHTDVPALGAALDRVIKEATLIKQCWRYDADSATLAITSASEAGMIHYATPDGCDCRTQRGVCRHRAAALVLQTLAGAGIQPVAMLPLFDEAELDEADCWDPSDELGEAEDAEEVVRWEDQEPEEPRYFELDDMPPARPAALTCPQCGGEMIHTLNDNWDTVEQCADCDFFLLVRP